MKSATVKYFVLSFFIGLVSLFGQTPYELVELKNPPKKLVQDYAQVFDAMQLNNLENKLVAYNDSTSTQILVLTVESLEGYPIETFANEIGEKWGVGQKGKDNGIVIVLSEKDRKITIRTGYASQIQLPPSINKSIIDQIIIPYFKNGDYAEGINAGVDTIFKYFNGKYKAEPKEDQYEVDWFATFILLFFIAFILYAIFGGGKNKGGGRGNGGHRQRSLLDDVILMNTGRSIFGGGGFGSGGGSFGGGSSGGGFGGFGGGSFGGGGASGSW
ncbi:TPM domain-containing protein [Faecalibacter rhinopitheci]|uniref:TPM domain-containing protein n=1 Tax=Faecalibacter rhinopitheci TaxID=2779678 RepID=A0A8J7FQN0_9FLAO|nr:TPM domain-containing protein [Faecalibacter rhinopitheci]MBF0596518.1 TPM domain-containing protein [Faecalibacter rhinopitheci]MBQ0147290.1 TPM domain-containing protein [Candidatus Onthonaster equi]